MARRTECPDCGSPNLVFEPENAQLICQDCGLLFEELHPEDKKKYDELEFL